MKIWGALLSICALGSVAQAGFDSVCIEQNHITVPVGEYKTADGVVTVTEPAMLTVSEVDPIRVKDEGFVLPKAPLNSGTWNGQGRLLKLRFAGITVCGSLDPQSVQVERRGRIPLTAGGDYLLEPQWGRIVDGPSDVVGEKEPVFVSYNCRLQRMDSVVVDEVGMVTLLEGTPTLVAPHAPELPDGSRLLLNVWRPYDSSQVLREHLFENCGASEITSTTPGRIPQTIQKLVSGEPVTIVCWGDSVTVGADLASESKRYSSLLEKRLRQRFPQANLTVKNISIGGTQSAFWLAGWDQRKTEGCTFSRVLEAEPDLVTIEFVNDARLPSSEYDGLYTRILTALQSVGSEMLLITPHFTHPVLMGTDDMRTKDPRSYVQFLKDFSEDHGLALADASARWEQLYAHGLPYLTQLANGWNHPNELGHELFAEELMKCFAVQGTGN